MTDDVPVAGETASMRQAVEAVLCSRCLEPVRQTVQYIRLAGAELRMPPTGVPVTCDDCSQAEAAEQTAEDRRTWAAARDAAMARVLDPLFRGATLETVEPAGLRQTLQEWARPPLSSSLFLYGAVGTGKTYVASAIVRRVWRPDCAPVMVNVPRYFEDLRQSFRSGKPPRHTGIERAALLVLDDLGVEHASPWVRERLYEVVNYRYTNLLPLVVTSNLSLDDIAVQTGEQVASRLTGMCRQVGLRGRDRRLPS